MARQLSKDDQDKLLKIAPYLRPGIDVKGMKAVFSVLYGEEADGDDDLPEEGKAREAIVAADKALTERYPHAAKVPGRDLKQEAMIRLAGHGGR